MRFLSHRTCPPGQLLPSTAESRPTETPTTGGMISRFHLPTYATHVTPTAVTHVALRHPWLPATASKNGLLQPREWTSQQHRPDCICVCCGPRNCDQRQTAAFSRKLLTNEYRKVGKQISKSRKTNPNSNVLFEVGIFELRLTSPMHTHLIHGSLGPPKAKYQTTCQSVQSVPILCKGPPLFPLKNAPSHEGIWTPMVPFLQSFSTFQ